MFTRISNARPALPPDEHRFRHAIRWSIAASAVLFLALLWNFGPHPMRTALPGGGFSGFYDDQATALVHGHLDIEPGAAGIEAFVVDGREYLYFPPGPAVLRIPIAAVTDRFEGRLTAPSMLIAWTLLVVLTGRLLWEVRRLVRHDGPLGRWELWMYACLHASICGGSVVLYLAAMPWVYHEAYMWSMALTVGALLMMFGLQRAPSTRRVLLLGLCILGAMMVRTTAGWALAGTALCLGVFAFWRKPSPELRRLALPIAAAGAVPLAAGIAVNWAKFSHPYLFALEKQVFTGLNAHRREALAANGGDLVSFGIAPTTLINYFRPDGIRFTSVFPFMTLPAKPAPTYGSAVIDQSYRTSSIPAFMPLMFGLTVWGILAMVTRGTRDSLRLLRFPVLASLAAAGPVIFYGYLAYRYTSEFIPLLIVGSAIGMTLLVDRFASSPRRIRIRVLAVVAFVTAFGAFANFATGVSAISVSNSGESLERYVKVQMGLSDLMGHPFDSSIEVVDELPRASAVDGVRIIGDCEASFYGSGDTYNPWQLMSMREWRYTVMVDPAIPATGVQVLVGTISSESYRATITVEVEAARFRTVVERPDKTIVGGWSDYEQGGSFQIDVLTSVKYGVYSVEPAPGDLDLVVPVITFDGEINLPAFLDVHDGLGLFTTVTAEPLQVDDLCTKLLARANTAS